MSTPSTTDSVHIIQARLEELGMSVADLASKAEMTPAYVARLLGRKITFPKSPATLVKLAQSLKIDPKSFEGYTRFMDDLPASARKVRQRMQDLGMTVVELQSRLDGVISEAYLNSILRGSNPFPAAKSLIVHIAAVLDIEPNEFEEFTAAATRSWSEAAMLKTEVEYLRLLVDLAISERGYASPRLTHALIDSQMLASIGSGQPGALSEIIERMGLWNIDTQELARLTKIGEARLLALFLGTVTGEEATMLAAIRRTLNLDPKVQAAESDQHPAVADPGTAPALLPSEPVHPDSSTHVDDGSSADVQLEPDAEVDIQTNASATGAFDGTPEDGVDASASSDPLEDAGASTDDPTNTAPMTQLTVLESASAPDPRAPFLPDGSPNSSVLGEDGQPVCYSSHPKMPTATCLNCDLEIACLDATDVRNCGG